MRVLHLSTEFPPFIYGGLGTVVGGLTAALAREGLDVAVLIIGSRDPYDGRQTKNTGATAGRCGAVALYWTEQIEVDAALRFVRWWKPDVIHLHSCYVAWIGLAIQRETEIPLVYHVHSLDRAEYELGEEPWVCIQQWETQRTVIENADRVIVLSESERRLVCDYAPAATERMEIAGNGVDDIVVADRSSRDELVILFTGRFVNRKGIHELFAAMEPVLRAVPNARFVLAGGHRECTAQQMTDSWMPPLPAPLRSRVEFTGWLDAGGMNVHYKTSDILVVPSWYEPFGMVVLEGMLNQLAIVATNVGGPAEILQNEQTALLIEPRDENAIAAALIRLCRDDVLRRRLAVAAAQEVRRTWLWRERVQTIIDVYSHATEGRAS
jgi:glycogen synthase